MSIETSAEIKAISKALFLVQSEAHGVAKNAQNPHFKNRYATLEAVIETARPALQKVGLVFTQAPGRMNNGAIEVSTSIIHPESGQWMRATTELPLSKMDPQGAGSAITYALRYSLMAMLGLPPVDDDAEAAVGRNQPAAPARPATPTSETAAQYVARAKADIALIKNEPALRTYWQNEKAHRDAHKLSADRGLGLELMTAYGDKKAQFQGETIAA